MIYQYDWFTKVRSQCAALGTSTHRGEPLHNLVVGMFFVSGVIFPGLTAAGMTLSAGANYSYFDHPLSYKNGLETQVTFHQPLFKTVHIWLGSGLQRTGQRFDGIGQVEKSRLTIFSAFFGALSEWRLGSGMAFTGGGGLGVIRLSSAERRINIGGLGVIVQPAAAGNSLAYQLSVGARRQVYGRTGLRVSIQRRWVNSTIPLSGWQFGGGLYVAL